MQSTRLIQRLLVANRGEIARRVMRTAHQMGISTIAVFSQSDRDAPHVREADTALALQGRRPSESYLDADQLLEVCRRAGADAVHPGYGFLSENATFARRVESAGLIWVGPPPDAIAAMGDKLAARRCMQSAGVPVLPACEIDIDTAGPEANPETNATATSNRDNAAASQSSIPVRSESESRVRPHDDAILRAGQQVGYPLLVKASAGGGGKGMRVVQHADDLVAAVLAARRESAAAFGNDTVYLERWLPSCRHVEVQILADELGNVVHCFERECSIQRRHQKIIEESPSPGVDDALRTRLFDAAIAAARAIEYRSAGTVEFLVSDGEFWFLEMNTRLQVEHPVTEMITGLDLVEEQLRIAQGEPIGFSQNELTVDGHAIEARLYAEDPAHGFLPVTGTVLAWEPALLDDTRIESGVEPGSEVGIEFDPLLAKFIAHAEDRRHAALRLARMLQKSHLGGLTTNRDFLVEVLRSDAFLSGDTTTDFIQRVPLSTTVREQDPQARSHAMIAAVLFGQAERRQRARVLRSIPSGWTNTKMPAQFVTLQWRQHPFCVYYRHRRDNTYELAINEQSFCVSGFEQQDRSVSFVVDQQRVTANVLNQNGRWIVSLAQGDVELIELPRFPDSQQPSGDGSLNAPMPGVVIAVDVAVDDLVEKGDSLLTLEAMKMENRVVAPQRGRVVAVHVRPGDQVAAGEKLVELEPAGEADHEASIDPPTETGNPS